MIAVRGATLVKLDVKTWVEADAIGNDELKALLNGPSAGRSVSLKKYYQNYQQDNGKPYCYVGVLTKEGRLAVVAVEDFSGPSSIAVRTRVRKPLWHASYRQHAQQMADDAKKYLNNDRTGHIIGLVMIPTSPDGYAPDLNIEVTGESTLTEIDPTTEPPKNATEYETFTVNGNVAQADRPPPAI